MYPTGERSHLRGGRHDPPVPPRTADRVSAGAAALPTGRGGTCRPPYDRSAPVGRLARLALALAQRTLPTRRDPARRAVKQPPRVSRRTGHARDSRGADINDVCRGPPAVPRPPTTQRHDGRSRVHHQSWIGRIASQRHPTHRPPARRTGKAGCTLHPNPHHSTASPRLPVPTTTRTGVGRKKKLLPQPRLLSLQEKYRQDRAAKADETSGRREQEYRHGPAKKGDITALPPGNKRLAPPMSSPPANPHRVTDDTLHQKGGRGKRTVRPGEKQAEDISKRGARAFAASPALPLPPPHP